MVATTEYFTSGSTILAEKTGDNILWYIYDSDGDLLGFTYNDTPYYYVKNVQGDVYRIVDSNGQVVASYTYDAWGKVLTATGTMADINPIRYRGYYYDSETGLYYLNSRYYDPETGRFVNADGYVSTGQGITAYNMFAYCRNNPIAEYDPTGHFGLLAGVIIITSAVVGGLMGAFSAAATGGNVVESTIKGTITGAVGAVWGLYLSPPAAFGVATGCGIIVDTVMQMQNEYQETGESNPFKMDIDEGAAIKTGLQTGIGATIPAFNEATTNVASAIGTMVAWADVAVLLTVADICVTNTMAITQHDITKGVNGGIKGGISSVVQWDE